MKYQWDQIIRHCIEENKANLSTLLTIIKVAIFDFLSSTFRRHYAPRRYSLLKISGIGLSGATAKWVAVISAKNHKRQRRKGQSVTASAKREKSQTPKVLTAILNLT